MKDSMRWIIFAVFGLALAWFGLLGFAGVASGVALDSAVGWSEAIRGAAGIQPLYDLIRVSIGGLPGHELERLWWLSMICAACTVGLVALTARRATHSPKAAIFSALACLFGVDAFWMASTAGPAAVAMLIGAMILACSTIERPVLRHLALSISGGISLAIAPPLFVVAALAWVSEFRDHRRGHARLGTTERLALPLSWFAVPVLVAISVIAANPWVWSDITSLTGTWLLSLLAHSPDYFRFFGTDYVSTRPPLWTGLAILAFETPLPLLVLAGLPLMATKVPPRALRSLYLAVFVGVASPWLIRSTAWGGVPIQAIWTPALAILAGAAVAGLFERIDVEDQRARRIATATVALIVVGMALETLAFRNAPVVYRNPLIGVSRAVSYGEPLRRGASLPPRAIESVSASHPALENLLDAYRRSGFVKSSTKSASSLAAGASRFDEGVSGTPLAKPRAPYLVDGIPLVWRDE